MIKIGICTSFDNVELAAGLGYDYLECALSQLAAMEEQEFEALYEKSKNFPIPVSRCNGFLPGNVKVTGPERDEDVLRDYLDKALYRASAIGIKTAVFGSGAARNVPDGWPFEKAWKQIADFLKLAAEYGEKYDVNIAIEPLRRQECNIVNLVSEAMALSAWADSPRVGALGDTFHMLSSHEPWNAFANAGDKLMHVHISCPLPDMSSRIYPSRDDGNDYGEIFQVLRTIGYEGGVSVEAGVRDLEADAKAAIECLKAYV